MFYTGELTPISNRADWRVTAELSDPETGAMIDLTGAEIKVALRSAETCCTLLTADESDGHIVINGTGIFTWAFLVGELGNVLKGPYDVGITIKLASGVTHQLVIATVPVFDGVVQ